MTTKEFKELMEIIATGWNTKHAKMAVDCFTDDATYIEPPDKQFFKGREQLYEYFGGDEGFDMQLSWNHLFFDEEKQMGCGEYTFIFKGKIHHGVTIVELENGKIKLWREYDTVGSLSYKDFIKTEGKVFGFTIKDLKKV
jgi:ketosteroid isomerase-like protein